MYQPPRSRHTRVLMALSVSPISFLFACLFFIFVYTFFINHYHDFYENIYSFPYAIITNVFISKNIVYCICFDQYVLFLTYFFFSTLCLHNPAIFCLVVVCSLKCTVYTILLYKCTQCIYLL